MTDDLDPESLDPAQVRARDAIAAPPPPLDDITRRRLVARALAEPPARPAHPARRQPDRAPWRVLVAAAAVIVVVGLGGWAVVGSLHTTNEKGSAGKADVSNTTTAAAPGLGEVSDPHQLLARVRAALAGKGSVAPTTNAPTADARCIPTLRVPSGVHPRVLGTATYRGAAVVVVVARDGARTLIYVLDQHDCHLLTAQFFRG
jgi:hypothetical protein